VVFVSYINSRSRPLKSTMKVFFVVYILDRELEEVSRIMKHGNLNRQQEMWYWASLQYANLETQFTWPLVHAISGVVVKVLKLIINDHYHNGNGSKIVNHKISKVRAPKEKNRQRVRGCCQRN
jgi:hypothetical protein